MSKGLVKGRQGKNEGDAMKIGDFVSYWKGKKFAAHYWGYVEKINRKTARVIVFYSCFTTGPVLMAFSYDNIPLECLRSEKAESRINTKWGVLSIQEIYQKACLEHKESVDALRTNAKAGHSASIDALRLLASCSAQVCSTEDFILDPRAELLKTRTCDPDQDKGGCLPKGE
jgi:hypothetical protein